MKRNVRRAPLPRSIPTLGQIAAALAIAAAAKPALADAGAPRAEPDAARVGDGGACATDTPSSDALLESFERLGRCEAACSGDAKERCTAERRLLAARIPTLTLLDQKAVNGTAPVRATLDGVERPLGVPLPTNPGRHTVRFEYEGAPATEEQIVVREGEAQVRAVSCPYAPDQANGGEPPPHDFIAGGGCCGGARAGRTAGLDLRAIAAAAVAVAFGVRRRRGRSD